MVYSMLLKRLDTELDAAAKYVEEHLIKALKKLHGGYFPNSRSTFPRSLLARWSDLR